MAKLPLLVAGAVVLLAGGALAGYGLTRPHGTSGGETPEAAAATAAAIGSLDGDIQAARSRVAERARTLSQIQPVRTGLSADKATVVDMYRSGALAFKPEHGEVIELGQIVHGQAPVPFLLQPDGAAPSPYAGKPGSYCDFGSPTGNQLLVTESAPVATADHADTLAGYVVVSQWLDIKAALAKLEAAHVAGTLDLGGKHRAIGAPVAGATQKMMPLSSVSGAALAIAVPPTVVMTAPPYAAVGGGAAGFGALLVIVGLVVGKRAAPVASIGTDATQVSGATAAPARTTQPPPVSFSGAAETVESGVTLGRWELIKRIGSGGMADVYLARALGEAGFAKQVCIKVMHPHLARNENAVQLFLDEARLAAQISHPNVVQIQDLGKISDDYVIVMEYVDGVDLERLLESARGAGRAVPVDVALGILARVCDGLDAAHHATGPDGAPMNLVHRDVKSANVLVSRQGTVKLVDFGIAKAASQSHLTAAGETKGTPSMMAPEQRTGQAVDARADVYSAAAVAYEILTGRMVNLDLVQLAHLGVEGWPHLPPPSQARADLPKELDAIIMTALSYDREPRPATIAALGGAFEAVMKQYALAATDKDIARWIAAEIERLPAKTA